MASDAQVQEELAARLAALERVFDLRLLEGRGVEEAEIACYYEQSRWAYRIFHSNEGVMHLALNPDGAFDKDGYYGQAREVERLIAPDAEAVLELAPGYGLNLRYLAKRFPGLSFTGVDLVDRHVAAARARSDGLRNLRFEIGDFHQLAFDPGTFDAVFAVESLCHATDLRRAFQEAHRVLRPGGLFVVIDCWRTSSFSTQPAITQRAAVAAEQALSVGRLWVIDDWLDAALDAGFDVVENRDLTPQVMPNVRRLERIARVILSYPRMARTAQRLLPERFLMNGIALYLMPITLAIGAHTYRAVALRRGAG